MMSSNWRLGITKDRSPGVAFKVGVTKPDSIRLGAVSYTHLDVYKRQFLYCLSCCHDCINGLSLTRE